MANCKKCDVFISNGGRDGCCLCCYYKWDVRLRLIEKYDDEHKSGLVLRLTIELDAVLEHPTYIVQFWRCVQFQGLDAAIKQLEQTITGIDCSVLYRQANRIKSLVEG